MVEQVKWKLENPAFLPCLFFEIGSHVAQAGLRLRARIISKCHHVWLTSFFIYFFSCKQITNPLRCKESGCSGEDSDPENEEVRMAFSHFWKVQSVIVYLLAQRIHILLPEQCS